MNEPPRRRRWLQYGLRSLVALMLVAALFCGYTAWWMRRLQEAEDRAAAAAKAAKEERRRAQVALEMAEVARAKAEALVAARATKPPPAKPAEPSADDPPADNP